MSKTCLLNKKPLLRDCRSPRPSSLSISKSMRGNRAIGTTPEILLHIALKVNDIRGFSKNCADLPGKPDICFKKGRLAIFVNGCFWHRCPYCKPAMPKTHRAFWAHKFERNKARDRKNRLELRKLGWHVVTIWECLLKRDPLKYVIKIQRMINEG